MPKDILDLYWSLEIDLQGVLFNQLIALKKLKWLPTFIHVRFEIKIKISFFLKTQNV